MMRHADVFIPLVAMLDKVLADLHTATCEDFLAIANTGFFNTRLEDFEKIIKRFVIERPHYGDLVPGLIACAPDVPVARIAYAIKRVGAPHLEGLSVHMDTSDKSKFSFKVESADRKRDIPLSDVVAKLEAEKDLAYAYTKILLFGMGNYLVRNDIFVNPRPFLKALYDALYDKQRDRVFTYIIFYLYG